MIYFLSDAHLGRLDSYETHQAKLIALLEQMSKDASAIYMLGDMFDFWFEYFIHDASKRRFSPLFKLLRKFKKQGIDVHYFTGNHDRWTFNGLKHLTGASIHMERCSLRRNNTSLFLAYGAGLYPYNWHRTFSLSEQRKIEKKLKHQAFMAKSSWQSLFRMLPPAWGNAIGYRWAKRQTIEETQEELLAYAKFEEKQGLHRDFYIFGHTHTAADIPITDKTRVIFLGDCFAQWTYAQLDEDGQLSLCRFEN